jgi:SNF family Na+-dependent transporter
MSASQIKTAAKRSAKRKRYAWIGGLAIFIVGVPSALSYGILSDVSIKISSIEKADVSVANKNSSKKASKNTMPNGIWLKTVVAVMAGVAIFPAVFAFGLKPDQGPQLLFNVLPT